MNKPIIIAIDGYSSCGKSTLAKDLASRLHYKYIDSGAMYRSVALFCLRNNINVKDKERVISVIDGLEIDFENKNGMNFTLLNGENVESHIRSMRVSKVVSEVATIPEVRQKLVAIQHKLGMEKGIVMDGRDITTVVFPKAEIKVFVTATIDIRTERRYQELVAKGKKPELHEVKKNLLHRDHIDSTRTHSPLRQADDAYLLDNTHLSREEQVEVILDYIDYYKKNQH